MAFDSNAHAIMERAKQLLKPLAAEFGISIEKVEMRTGSSQAMLTIAMVDYDIEARNAEMFKEQAPLHGIPVELLGRKFCIDEQDHTLVGYRFGTNKKPLKQPFIVLVGQRECCASESYVKKLLVKAGLLPAAE